MKPPRAPSAFLGLASALLLSLCGTMSADCPELPAQFELSQLDGVNGFTLNGIVTTGARVAGAGDVNGDGFPDFYVSDSSASPNGRLRAGQVFVVFGAGGNFQSILELSSLDGTNGFVLNGVAAEDRLFIVSARPGDVNGDGGDDLLIGAASADPDGIVRGQAYVIYGVRPGLESDDDGDGLAECSGDCNDGNPAIHPGALEVCDGADNDCDGTADNAPAPSGNPLLTVEPSGEGGLVSWSPVSDATDFDVVYGNLQVLVGSGGDYSTATIACPASHLADTTFSLGAEEPPVGEGFWYLVRPCNCVGRGTYDSGGVGQVGSRDQGITACP